MTWFLLKAVPTSLFFGAVMSATAIFGYEMVSPLWGLVYTFLAFSCCVFMAAYLLELREMDRVELARFQGGLIRCHAELQRLRNKPVEFSGKLEIVDDAGRVESDGSGGGGSSPVVSG